MTNTWLIEKLVCKASQDGLSNVVYEVHWRYVKSLTLNGEEYSVNNSGVAKLSSPDPNSFTGYDDLTKAQVVAWVQAKLGQEYITDMDSRLTSSINDKSTQVILDLPFEN
jgi:hypothetical protein